MNELIATLERMKAVLREFTEAIQVFTLDIELSLATMQTFIDNHNPGKQ